MNKKSLVEAVAKELGTTNAAAERAVNAFVKGIESGLKKDRTVSIVGFGAWRVKDRKARVGRNPQTGEQIKIKASRTVGFKPGKQ
ncbi:HU family DNA-binding protein, partial [bacterium]|nr:HU family DNA-binding protein [bacterium]